MKKSCMKEVWIVSSHELTDDPIWVIFVASEAEGKKLLSKARHKYSEYEWILTTKKIYQTADEVWEEPKDETTKNRLR